LAILVIHDNFLSESVGETKRRHTSLKAAATLSLQLSDNIFKLNNRARVLCRKIKNSKEKKNKNKKKRRRRRTWEQGGMTLKTFSLCCCRILLLLCACRTIKKKTEKTLKQFGMVLRPTVDY
jgi:hypothetical protein